LTDGKGTHHGHQALHDQSISGRPAGHTGFPVGPSSGLNYRGATIAARSIGPAKIVTVLPDRMERDFSSELFAAVRGDSDLSR
jgi:hypothetical protein